VVQVSGQDACLLRCFGHVLPGGGLRADSGAAGETASLGWPGNNSVSSRKSWRRGLGRGRSGDLCLDCPDPDKVQIDG